MPRKEFIYSGYTTMYLVVLFDLPVKTKKNRKDYAQFRKILLRDGFNMLQYSVYSRYCASEQVASQHRQTVKNSLPPDGRVRVLDLTTRQFEKMESFWGRKKQPSEKEPDTFTLY